MLFIVIILITLLSICATKVVVSLVAESYFGLDSLVILTSIYLLIIIIISVQKKNKNTNSWKFEISAKKVSATTTSAALTVSDTEDLVNVSNLQVSELFVRFFTYIFFKTFTASTSTAVASATTTTTTVDSILAVFIQNEVITKIETLPNDQIENQEEEEEEEPLTTASSSELEDIIQSGSNQESILSRQQVEDDLDITNQTNHIQHCQDLIDTKQPDIDVKDLFHRFEVIKAKREAR